MGTHAPVMLYIDSESKAMVETLWWLRKVAKDGNVDLVSLKTITQTVLEAKASKWPRYYKINKTPNLLKEVVNAMNFVHNFEEYLKLIEPTWQYLNVWNYLIDLQIPWAKISAAYDRTLK